MPFKDGDQDSYEDLMKMEDKEIRFWDRVDKVPNNMEVEEWEAIRADYFERMRIAREEGIAFEKTQLEDIFKHLEVKELNDIRTNGDLPKDILNICVIAIDGSGMLISRKWDVYLCHANDMFKYEKDAIQRDKYYQMTNNVSDDRYEQWLDYMAECQIMTGKTYDMFAAVDEGGLSEYETEVVTQSIDGVAKKLIEKAKTIVIEEEVVVKKKRVYSEGEEDEDEIEEDEDGNIIRNEEELQLDDEYDDTYAEVPEEYIKELASVNGMDKEVELQQKEEPEDEWGF
jgi:hypothetical protein